MEQSPRTYDQLLDRFVAWAAAQPDVGAAFVIGSQARATRPADVWSDLDVVVIVDTPARYLSETAWLEAIGAPWITFIESTGGEQERRVLFDGGLDVDFVMLSRRKIRLLSRFLLLQQRWPFLARLLPKPVARQLEEGLAPFADVVRRGARVLLDKDGIVEPLLRVARARQPAQPPSQDAFVNLVHDMWYHAVWTAKKLRRGEWWTAKGCSDAYMKRRLLSMIEWHAHATHGWDYDTWHSGRFLEQWADERIVTELREAFAHYDAADLWRGLVATMDLFRWVAVETATLLQYPYPAVADAHATALVQHLRAEAG